MGEGVRCFAALFLTALVAAAPLHAQDPPTEAGALAAAVRFLRTMPRVGDSIPIVTDTAAVRRALTRCTEVPGAAPSCVLVDGREAWLVLVRLRAAASAEVEVREYQVLRRTCAFGEPSPEPMLGYLAGQHWTMAYVDGRWTWDKRGRGWVC